MTKTGQNPGVWKGGIWFPQEMKVKKTSEKSQKTGKNHEKTGKNHKKRAKIAKNRQKIEENFKEKSEIGGKMEEKKVKVGRPKKEKDPIIEKVKEYRKVKRELLRMIEEG